MNVKYNPLTAIADHLFNGSIADVIGSDFVKTQASSNVIETEKTFKIELAAPGLEKKDFNINIEKDQLKISVDKEKEEGNEKEKFTRREFSFTSFQRSFNLSEQVNPEGVSAVYENGVLTVILPKKEIDKTVLSRTIEIS
ncbi:MAG: HSP20 family protein [Saprospiraceae bacterium]|jgi:HSP20 family protein